ncbi:MAG: 16S rRNA (cytidine(1402)-2'-O)-methyltransferase [Patescibacteria group bacterium]|nr:16S rRNA (cytidine(1402)-2'-O)-methyltransferase [Patescibacteria group bacterium]
MMLGSIYVVATPIGNLEDITLRALKIIKEVDFLYAEDTRKTNILLSHYGIKRQILSYHAHSFDAKKEEILKHILEGKSVALVTDAGTPGISDPGNELVDYILNKDPEIKIIPVPGASSITALISVAGWNLSKFLFIGFFPKKKKTRFLELAKNFQIPIVFYESPFRIVKTLEFIRSQFGVDIQVIVGRELTKKFEEIIRGNINYVLAKLRLEKKIKGEITVIAKITTKLKGQI